MEEADMVKRMIFSVCDEPHLIYGMRRFAETKGEPDLARKLIESNYMDDICLTHGMTLFAGASTRFFQKGQLPPGTWYARLGEDPV